MKCTTIRCAMRKPNSTTDEILATKRVVSTDDGLEASERGLHGRGNGDDPKVGDKVRWEDLVAPRGAASNCERSQTGSCPHLHCSVQLRVRQCGCATGNAAPRQGRGGWEAAASRVGDSSSLPGAEGHKPTGHATGGSRCKAARFVNVTAPPPATGQLYKARATSRHGPIQLRRLERGLEISRSIKVKRGWCQGIGFVSGRHGCSEPGAGTVEHEGDDAMHPRHESNWAARAPIAGRRGGWAPLEPETWPFMPRQAHAGQPAKSAADMASGGARA